MSSSTKWLLMSGILISVCGVSWGAELSDQQLKQARSIFLGKCAKCHSLPEPAGYTKEKWDAWVERMRIKARLSQSEHVAVSNYTEILRSRKK